MVLAAAIVGWQTCRYSPDDTAAPENDQIELAFDHDAERKASRPGGSVGKR